MPHELRHRATAVVQVGEAPRVSTASEGLDYPLVTPEGLGGRGGDGVSAEGLLAAGYAACFHAALGYAATLRGVTLPANVRVSASVEVGRGAEEPRFEADIIVEAALPSLAPAAARDLVEAARDLWPYGGGMPSIDVRPAAAGVGSDQASAEAAEGRGYGG